MKRHTMIGHVEVAPCPTCGHESILAAIHGVCLRCSLRATQATTTQETSSS
jgi:hypothetical protein